MRTKTMKIQRDGVEVGVVDLATAELHSADTTLIQLWNRWLKNGFRVLGSAPDPVPKGVVCAVALLNIHPSPDNLGLVAIELGNNGYELEFE